jgi:hypothetical protein
MDTIVINIAYYGSLVLLCIYVIIPLLIFAICVEIEISRINKERQEEQ